MKRSALQQKALDDLLLQVADENEVELQEALRNILVNLRHVAHQRYLQFSHAVTMSQMIYEMELLTKEKS